MTASLTIGGTERSPVTFYDVTVDTGRDDIESQPDSSVFNATLNGYTNIELGQYVELADSSGILFHGWVTDLTADLEPETYTWTTEVTATGPLAMLGHMRAGHVDYPQETDSQRIHRVLTEAGAAHNVNPNIIGPDILPRLAAVEPAEKLARSPADDGMGVLWEQPADTLTPIRYAPSRVRRWGDAKITWSEFTPTLTWAGMGSTRWMDMVKSNVGATPEDPPELELNPATTLARATFGQQINDFARTVTVEYGPEPEDGNRATITVGTREPVKDYTTDLAVFGDAATYADTMLRRTQQPAWRLENIRVPLHALTPGERDTIRAALTVGTRITIPFPLGSPIGYAFQGFIEGWRHQLISDGYEQHWLDLHTSERSLTEAADRWLDINPTITWDQTRPDMQWNQTITWEAAS